MSFHPPWCYKIQNRILKTINQITLFTSNRCKYWTNHLKELHIDCSSPHQVRMDTEIESGIISGHNHLTTAKIELHAIMNPLKPSKYQDSGLAISGLVLPNPASTYTISVVLFGCNLYPVSVHSYCLRWSSVVLVYCLYVLYTLLVCPIFPF